MRLYSIQRLLILLPGLSGLTAGLLCCGCVKDLRQTSGGQAGNKLVALPAPEGQPLTSPSAGTGAVFTLLSADESGIDFTNKADSRELRIESINFWAGLASGDYDADGDLDVYLCGVESPNKLLRNEGGMRFTDVTAEAGGALDCGLDWSSGAVFADLSADGLLDLYVSNTKGQNRLFIGDGKGGFTEEADKRGAAVERCTTQSAVLDADRDGDLDLYLANYRLTKVRERYLLQELTAKGAELKIDPRTHVAIAPPEAAGVYYLEPSGKLTACANADMLLINDGKGSFSDNSKAAGIDFHGWSLQPLAADFNDDGFTDIYVSGDFESPDKYFINNGDGTFTDRAREMLRRTSFFSMGSDAGDLNADGQLDFYVGDMLPSDYKDARKQSGDMNEWRWELIQLRPQQNMRNTLFVGRGGGWMSECAELAGVQSSDWTWSCRIADLNCDGLPELFASNGYPSRAVEVDNVLTAARMQQEGKSNEEIEDFLLSLPPYLSDDAIFTPSAPLKYQKAADNWGIHDNSIGTGASLADYDGDGDQDLLVNCVNSPALLYRNDVAVDGQRVVIELAQPGANSAAVGARVLASFGGGVQAQEVVLARGFATGESPRLYFGLGSAPEIERLEIRWPDGSLQLHEHLAGGKFYRIERAAKLSRWEPEDPQPLFKLSELDWRHEENTAIGQTEYEKEPLLPIQQSMLGSGGAVADYDNDGALDAYLCGAAGQPGQLLRGDGKGGFSAVALPLGIFPDDAEQMAALWLDANADNKLDLLVTLGGMEAPAGSESYGVRLLLQTQQGFQPMQLPARQVSTAAACAGDLDGDGDVDLFLAGHLVPFAYGKAAPSAVWLNSGKGEFSDATAAWLPSPAPGQISDAQLADMDSDGRLDLITAQRWGSVCIYPNTGSSFAAARPLSPSGWWQSIAAGDLDNDGDLDLLAGNSGGNTKYHPKDQRPVLMYAADFDGNGTRDLIETKWRNDGCLLPGRGRSCSGYAVGYIPQKWPTWASFADATFEEIYGARASQAEKFEASELQSLLLRNEGGWNFSPEPLPGPAQWAPVFGIALADFNCDGNLDAWLSQNFDGPQPETGHWTSGYGALLSADGKGGFTVLEPGESGVLQWEDGRGALLANFDGDSRADMLLTVSNAAPRLALGQESRRRLGSDLWVSLTGRSPNTASVGARLNLKLDNGQTLSRVVQCGAGYLCGYSGAQHFGIPEGAKPLELQVLWPDGSSAVTKQFSAGKAELKQ
ncbi:VCBS repeat-containing protein [bacterium]|nr:VCBS repeat-containing protein [bacterium]